MSGSRRFFRKTRLKSKDRGKVRQDFPAKRKICRLAALNGGANAPPTIYLPPAEWDSTQKRRQAIAQSRRLPG
jgi:hypothetical protein